jgi:hypothetical protein
VFVIRRQQLLARRQPLRNESATSSLPCGRHSFWSGCALYISPWVQLMETEIFHDSHERRLPNYPDISRDEPYLGTSFGQGGGGFNQFRSMEIAISGSDFLRNPGPSTLDGTEPVSSSRGYQSQEMVHPDLLMSRSVLGFRGSCRERGACCVRQMVNYIQRMCHPLQRSQVVVPARPMNCLRMLGLVILPLMRLATLMHQLLLSVNRMKKIVRSQNAMT